MSGFVIHQGSAVDVLPTLAADSVDCVVTSPPYWGLRDYGVDGQLGLERTPEEYVAKLVSVFREVRRVLKSDGTLWLNLGDCYATGAGAVGECPGGGEQGARWRGDVDRARDDKRGYRGDRLPNGHGSEPRVQRVKVGPKTQPNRMPIAGLKPKDLVGIPWRVAFALQADGWYLRSDIVWSKPNPMPESVEDRPTKAHEYVFLLSKAEVYRFDFEAILEPFANGPEGATPWGANDRERNVGGRTDGRTSGTGTGWTPSTAGRRKRSVWTIPTEPFPEAHFAVMPTALVKPCVLAGCRPGGTVLDPFTGSGTVGYVAHELGCEFVGIEINPEYVELARKRIGAVAGAPLLPFGDPS